MLNTPDRDMPAGEVMSSAEFVEHLRDPSVPEKSYGTKGQMQAEDDQGTSGKESSENVAVEPQTSNRGDTSPWVGYVWKRRDGQSYLSPEGMPTEQLSGAKIFSAVADAEHASLLEPEKWALCGLYLVSQEDAAFHCDKYCAYSHCCDVFPWCDEGRHL
jgi:hypothetical protein